MAARARAQSADYTVIAEPQSGPQTALLACPIFEVFFGGARGGGKTFGMLLEWVSHQDLYSTQASGLMVRRTLRDLEDTIKLAKTIYLPLGARWNATDKIFTFPAGGEIKFRYLDNDSDADHYQGHSYTRIYVEELGQFPSPDPVLKLMATLRSGSGVPCGFRATGNPGGPGHQWVKSRYIDPAPLGWKVHTREFRNPWSTAIIKRDWVFIPSKLKDNRFLGDEYVANLQMSGSEQLVRAWLEGDWSVIEGAFFAEWNSARHIITPFSIPPHWYRFRSGDWGSARPFSIGWWAVVGDDYPTIHEILGERPSTPSLAGYGNGSRHNGNGNSQCGFILPRGALVRYREWYGASSPNVGLKLPAESVAAGIVERERDEPKGEETGVSIGPLDPSAFSSDGGPSIAERFAMPPNSILWRRADNARVARAGAMGGWDQLRARLIGTAARTDTGSIDWSSGSPMIYFFSTCKDSIRTIPALQHDKNRPEDVDTESEDHAGDDTRYACMSRPYTRPEKRPEPIRGASEMTMDEAWDLAKPKNHQQGIW